MELTYLTEPNCSFRVHWGPLIIPTDNSYITNLSTANLTNFVAIHASYDKCWWDSHKIRVHIICRFGVRNGFIKLHLTNQGRDEKMITIVRDCWSSNLLIVVYKRKVLHTKVDVGPTWSWSATVITHLKQLYEWYFPSNLVITTTEGYLRFMTGNYCQMDWI